MTGNQLISLRYLILATFALFQNRACKQGGAVCRAVCLLLLLQSHHSGSGLALLQACGVCGTGVKMGWYTGLQSLSKSESLSFSNMSCLLVQASRPILVPPSTAAAPPGQDTELVLDSAAAILLLS